jgi:hypothetical protein
LDYGTTNSCLTEPIKITLNPSGDNAVFIINDDRDYNLTISFDYLFSLKCETILNKLNEPYNINNLNCNTPLNIFEGLDVSLNLDIITSANTTETVYSSNLFPAIGDGNLYEYITTNVDSGFMFVVRRVLMKHLQVAHPLLCQQQLITLLLRIYNRKYISRVILRIWINTRGICNLNT